jgi:hypothetical protein
MATRRYSINNGDNEYQVTEAIGAPTVTKAIELTIDSAVITDTNGGKAAIQIALSKLRNYILRGSWPPA